MGPYSSAPTSTASQRITTSLDTTKRYNVNFNIAVRQSNGPATCGLVVYADDASMWSKTITNFSFGNYVYETYVADFTPASSNPVIKFAFTCTGLDSSWSGTYLFLDDITMASA